MRAYQDLINKVIKELGLRKVTGADLSDEEAEILHTLSPIITVSRDPGSGGRPIAEKLAKKMGFTYYGQELVDEIAKSAKLRKALLSEVDEKGRSLMIDFVHTLFNPDYVSDVEYMRHLCKVILSVAYKGKAVILGRGANFVVPAASALRVRITASDRVRQRRAVKYEGYTAEEANKINRETEKDRREFVKQYFGENVSQPKHYDLVLNTDFYTIDQSVSVISAAFRQKFSQGVM